MNNVGGVSGAVPVAFSSAEAVSALDGDTIMAYCQQQLGDLGAQIKLQMNDQASIRDRKEKLNALRSELGKHTSGDIKTPEDRKAILDKFGELLAATPPGAPREALLASFNEFRRTAIHRDVSTPVGEHELDAYLGAGIDKDRAATADTHGNNVINAGEVKSMIERLDGISGDMTKDAELKMIDLQQLISQRQMAVQISTNLMNKYSQSLEAICGNLGK